METKFSTDTQDIEKRLIMLLRSAGDKGIDKVASQIIAEFIGPGICGYCGGSGEVDSGAITPWDTWISIPCICGDGTNDGLAAYWQERAYRAETAGRGIHTTDEDLEGINFPPEEV